MDLSSGSNCPPTPPQLENCPATPNRPIIKSNPESTNVSDESSNEERLSNVSENPDPSASPPPNCAICLYKCRNKSFTDSCLHQFCFTCLLQWSKVKAECPLCKQAFKSIIHNVRSNDDYEEYLVRPSLPNIPEPFLGSVYELPSAHRFRFRTTLNIPRHEEIALQNFLLDHPFTNSLLASSQFHDVAVRHNNRTFVTRAISARHLRSIVYQNNLWAIPLPDVTGRYRECSASFFRCNPAQKHRLYPWLNRELKTLLNDNQPHISYVMNIILDLIPEHDINSSQFRSALQPYFTTNTDHFIHELYQFARSPFDMVGYDRHAQYVLEEQLPDIMTSVISSSSDSDSDVQIVSSTIIPRNENATYSSNNSDSVIYVNDESMSVMMTSEPRVGFMPNASNRLDPLISIETISPSSDDDDSDACIITGVVKPPQQRTPELVTLDSDNDVTDVVSIPSDDDDKSSVSNWSANSGVSQLNQPSTSRVCTRQLSATLGNSNAINIKTLSSSSVKSSSDSDSDFNVPLVAFQKTVSNAQFNESQSRKHELSDNDHRDSKKRKINSKKGKTLVRSATYKAINRAIIENLNCDTSTDTEDDDKDYSVGKKFTLRSVIFRRDENVDGPNPINNPSVFNQSENRFEYNVGRTYYNSSIIPENKLPFTTESSTNDSSVEGMSESSNINVTDESSSHEELNF